MSLERRDGKGRDIGSGGVVLKVWGGLMEVDEGFLPVTSGGSDRHYPGRAVLKGL